MLLLNIDHIPGKNVEALGIVKGTVVQSQEHRKRLYGRDEDPGRRRNRGLHRNADGARQIATKRMVDKAEAMGADAIINIRYGSSAVMQGAAEVIAYGTAVQDSMMRISFLGHSGFLLELPSATLLFDWSEGELPTLRPGRPLLVFASHHHEDHFRPAIFQLGAAAFLLGKDVRMSARNRERWGVSPEAAARCVTLGGGRRLEPLPGVRVETLTSTDEGVAFLVTADGQTVFHAGDLNWWHWEGEDPVWNRNMEADFRRYAEPLRGRKIDLAMLPLDPRLGEDGFRGPRYFLELADIRRFLPMHQWGNFNFTNQFLSCYTSFTSRTVYVNRVGQVFTFEEEADT